MCTCCCLAGSGSGLRSTSHFPGHGVSGTANPSSINKEESGSGGTNHTPCPSRPPLAEHGHGSDSSRCRKRRRDAGPRFWKPGPAASPASAGPGGRVSAAALEEGARLRAPARRALCACRAGGGHRALSHHRKRRKTCPRGCGSQGRVAFPARSAAAFPGDWGPPADSGAPSPSSNTEPRSLAREANGLQAPSSRTLLVPATGSSLAFCSLPRHRF